MDKPKQSLCAHEFIVIESIQKDKAISKYKVKFETKLITSKAKLKRYDAFNDGIVKSSIF